MFSIRYFSFLPIILFFNFVPGLHALPLTRNVLFLGNSYTYVNNLPQLISDVANSTGDTLLFDSNTPGGYTLVQHFADSTSTGKIMTGGWDYVVMQEQSQLPSFDNYVPTGAEYLSDLIRQYNPCARKMFYMTWGRKNGDASNCIVWPPVCTYNGMDSLLRLRYIEMATTLHAEISPVGAVWHYLRQNNPTIELYQTDESHPSEAGSYAAACSFYAALFKKDPSLITFDFTLSPADAAAIRNAAKTIVYDSLANWEFPPDAPSAGFNYTIGPGINEVIFSNTSLNADSYSWDFGDTTASTDKNPVHTYIHDGTYTITLTATTCDLLQVHQSVYQLNISFCSHSPTVSPDSLIVCPNSIDTLWTQPYDSYQWLENGIPLPNETNQYLIPSHGAFYSMLATQNNCTELSQEIYVSYYSTGLVIFYVDSISNSIHQDTLCKGDTLKLILFSNKPYGTDLYFHWYDNGVLLPNATDDTLLVTASGNYSVSVFHSYYCPDYPYYSGPLYPINFIDCNIGIDEPGFDSPIEIYPNPSDGVISVKINSGLIGKSFSLTDIYGRIVSNGTFEKEINIFDLNGFCNGVYFLQFKQINIFAIKIIKQ